MCHASPFRGGSLDVSSFASPPHPVSRRLGAFTGRPSLSCPWCLGSPPATTGRSLGPSLLVAVALASGLRTEQPLWLEGRVFGFDSGAALRRDHSDQVLHHVCDASVLCQMPHAQIQHSLPAIPTFSVTDKGSDCSALALTLR